MTRKFAKMKHNKLLNIIPAKKRYGLKELSQSKIA